MSIIETIHANYEIHQMSLVFLLLFLTYVVIGRFIYDRQRSAAHMCITYDTVNGAFLDVQNRHSKFFSSKIIAIIVFYNHICRVSLRVARVTRQNVLTEASLYNLMYIHIGIEQYGTQMQCKTPIFKTVIQLLTIF